MIAYYVSSVVVVMTVVVVVVIVVGILNAPIDAAVPIYTWYTLVQLHYPSFYTDSWPSHPCCTEPRT